MIGSYGKVYALGHRMIANIFADPVVVEEKIDGSQFSFGVFDGRLICRSKNVEIVDGNEGMFFAGCETARALAPKLQEGWTYRGEYLSKPRHNALAYDRVPERHVMLFDVDRGNQDYLSADERQGEAERLGLESVPVIHHGPIESRENVHELMAQTSCLGGQTPEGLVFKNHFRCCPDGKTLKGKYVRDGFKEVLHKTWKTDNPKQGDILEILCDRYRTPARWDKAVQHIRERGELEGSPRDIGNLIQEVQSDLVDECADEIKEMLYKWAIKQVTRKAVAGLPEWYKERLLGDQFAPANDNGGE